MYAIQQQWDEGHVNTQQYKYSIPRGKVQTQIRLVAVSLSVGENNTARPGADPLIAGVGRRAYMTDTDT